jgi:DNA repair exonuclease SbcCD ATPase subunit
MSQTLLDKNKEPSKQAYRERVIKGAKTLVNVEIRPDDRKSSLRESLETVLEQLHQKEIELYGQVPTQAWILEEIKTVDAELQELKEQYPELYEQTPSKQQLLTEIQKSNEEIALLEREKAEIEKEIAKIRAMR